MKLIAVALLVAVLAIAWGQWERTKRLVAEAQLETAEAKFDEAADINAGNRAVLGRLQVELAGCSERLARSQLRFAQAEAEHQDREAARVAALRATQQELSRVLQANRDWADAAHPADVGRLLNAAHVGEDRGGGDPRG